MMPKPMYFQVITTNSVKRTTFEVREPQLDGSPRPTRLEGAVGEPVGLEDQEPDDGR